MKINSTIKYVLAIAALGFAGNKAMAQLKVGNNPGTINPNSILELEHSSKGFVLTKVALSSLTSRSPLSAGSNGPLTGTMVFHDGSNSIAAGIYYWTQTGTPPTTTGYWTLLMAGSANLTATTPLSYNSGTGVLSISQANGTGTNGYLSSTNWNTFNNKVDNITGTSGRISVDSSDKMNPVIDLVTTGVTAGTYTKVTVDAYGRVTSTGTISTSDLTDFAISSPATGEFLRWNGSKWVNTTASLDDLSDVAITSPSSNQILYYDGSTWKNGGVNSTITKSDLTSTTSGVSITGGTGAVLGSGGTTVNIATASGSQNGLLSSGKYTYFYDKVDNITGTANRISIDSTNLMNPVIDIASTYAGQTSITTLGTITTGTWNGTTIAIANGGTGATTQQGAINNLTSASGNSGKYLRSDGTDATFSSLSASDMTGVLSPANGGTGVNNGTRSLTISTNGGTLDFSGAGKTLTIADNGSIKGTNTGDVSLTGENYLSITNQTITVGAVDLSGTNATGTLAAARFGALTGDVTNTAGSYATTVAKINGATLGTTTATSGNLLIGDGSKWESVAMSGDVTINSSGATAIGAGKVTNAMLAGNIDLTTKVTGVLPSANGGTGINNGSNTITLGGNINTAGAFSTSGANALTLTTTAATNVTLPTSGTLYGTQTGSITSSQLANSLTDESGSGSAIFATLSSLTSGDGLTWNGSNWVNQAAGTGNNWATSGNTTGGVKQMGSNDAYDVNFITNGTTRMTITSGGDVNIANAATVGGALTASSTSDLKGAVSNSTGNLNLNDNVDIANNGTVGGTFDVTGATTLKSTTDMQGAVSNSTGNLNLNDAVDVGNTLKVGTINAGDSTDGIVTADGSGNIRKLSYNYVTSKVNIKTVSASYTATASDNTIICNMSAGTYTLTLPSPLGTNIGRIYRIIYKDGSSTYNELTVSPALNFGDGITGNTFNHEQTLTVQSNGTSWVVISHQQ